MQENKFITPIGEFMEMKTIECPEHILIDRLAELGIIKGQTASREAAARYNNRKGE